ncbi:MAG: hypothetical protein ACRECP_00965 [Methylocella sp.]
MRLHLTAIAEIYALDALKGENSGEKMRFILAQPRIATAGNNVGYNPKRFCTGRKPA